MGPGEIFALMCNEQELSMNKSISKSKRHCRICHDLQLSPLKIAVTMAASLCHIFSPVFADSGDELLIANFDKSMLWGQGARAIDLTRYAAGNPIDAGVQTLDVTVNTLSFGQFDIKFNEADRPGRATPCFSAALLDSFGVNTDKLPAAVGVSDGGVCVDFSKIPNASYEVNTGDQSLMLSIPQIYMRNNPRGYVGPERWNNGVTAGFIDYTVNGYQNSLNGQSSQNIYAGFNMGLNLGAWRLRQRSTLNWDDENGSKVDAISTYIQRDIDALRAQLTLGDTFSDGDLFDSVSIRGARIASDNRMLPDSQSNYAPVVRGIATTNARVTVRQRGYVIYETTVSPGNFEISDLNPGSNNGDLDVTVTEANGEEKHFVVPFSSVARSLRPGVSRFTASAGLVRNLQYNSNPHLVQATWQRGLTNIMTVYGGVTGFEDYKAALLGVVLGTQWGAVGLDVTQANTDLGKEKFSGQSVRVSYNKILTDVGTDVTLAAYRYSTDGYFGLSDALSATDQVKAQGDETANSIRRLRTRSEVIVNQRLTDSDYVYISGSRQDYWNDSGYDTQLQAGYTRSWSWGNTNISVARTQDPYGKDDNRVMVSFSLPFGTRSYLTTSASQGSDGNSNLQTSFNSTIGEDQRLSYGISASYDRADAQSSSKSLSSNAQYRTSFGTLNGSLSKSADYHQISAGISGSVVAHPEGVTFGQSLGDTIGIISAPGAKGAQVLNSQNVELDGSGQAVVPYLTAYRRNEVSLDPIGLSDDVELKNTSQEVIPRSGAVMMVKYDTVSGHAVLIKSRRQDGSPLPFGASVFDKLGQEVGAVGQGGQIFARVNDESGDLFVSLSDKKNSLCVIPYRLATHSEKNISRIDAVCR